MGRDLDRARSLFRAQQANGRFPGGQLVVRRDGELLLDEAVGFRCGLRLEECIGPKQVTPETRFATFSACKPLIAMAIAMCEERGLLDVEAPIAEVMPGFESGGKGSITTLDVLTHRSGLIVPAVGQERADWTSFESVVAKLVAARPRYPRGRLIYQPYEFGFLLAAIVERVAGRSFVDFFASEITGPAGLDGLSFRVEKEETAEVARSYFLGSRPMTVSGVVFDIDFEPDANSLMLESFVPGGNVVANARLLASFYELLLNDGVARSGKRIFSADLVKRYTSRHVLGLDRLNRFPLAVARGFLLGTPFPSVYGWYRTEACFGHSGAMSTLAFGDRRSGIAAAVVTNGNRSIEDMVLRFVPLAHAIRRLR